MPHAAAADWVAACLPRFSAFIAAHSANNHHARGLALDAILLAPAQFLVRKGGGWNCRKAAVKLQQHIRSLLAQGPLPRPPLRARGVVPADAAVPDLAWKRKLLRSAELASRGQWRRAAQVLSRPDFVPPSAVSCAALRAKQTSSDTAIPALPPDTPRIIIDPEVLESVIRGSADGRTGGPSGWTAELMLPLWDNVVCKQGICLLIELISNDDLDPHSRLLLTSSVLFGIPKKNSDVRPLAIGDEFLKLAERVCLGLVRSDLSGIFEPVQLGISPSGPERAIQILQAALEANPEHVATHVDLVNMFNSCDRGLALAEAYADPLLAGVRRVMSFAYSTPSPLLVRDRGVVVDSFLSTNGGRQGDCLAGLLCARFFQPVYTACLAGLPSLTACAIMDDFSFVGDPAECLTAFERLRRLARERGVEVHPDSCLQIPRGEPSEALAGAAAAQSLRIVRGNTDYLGGVLGLDDAGLEAWVRDKLAALSPVERAITDDDFPALHATRFAKMNLHSMPTYICRALPFRASAGPVCEFGDRVRDAVFRRLRLPEPLPDSAIISWSQPSRNGGMGMRCWRSVGPAAKFASAAIVAPDLLPFSAVSPPLPFVRDREHCYALLARGGVEVQGNVDDDAADHKAPSDDPHACPHFTLPADPADIATHYQGECRVRGLQRSLTKQLDDHALQRFRASLGCAPLDRVRLSCCSRSRDQPMLGAWFASTAQSLDDQHTRIAVRLRLGLPPLPSLPVARICPLCEIDLAGDSWHALSCQSLKRLSIFSRHELIVLLLIQFLNSNGFLARTLKKNRSDKLPDIEVHLPHETIFLDVSGTHPLNPSYLSRTLSNPNAALDYRANYKAGKYDAWAAERNGRFLPFVLDSFGRLQQQALVFLDLVAENTALLAPSPTRMSFPTLRSIMSSQWQRGNGLIVGEWAIMCRDSLSRASH